MKNWTTGDAPISLTGIAPFKGFVFRNAKRQKPFYFGLGFLPLFPETHAKSPPYPFIQPMEDTRRIS
jgi:hypothetical protein